MLPIENKAAHVCFSTGVDSEDGLQRRPWGPATRVLEHKEAEAITAAADAAKRCGGLTSAPPASRHLRTGFDPIDVRCFSLACSRMCSCWRHQMHPSQVGENTRQVNEGKWPFTFAESADGGQVMLTVDCGHHVDSADIAVNLQPTLLRILIKASPCLPVVFPCDYLKLQCAASIMAQCLAS